jgi:hypothetical protein
MDDCLCKKPHREDGCIFTNVKILIGIFSGNTYAITRMAAEIFWYGLNPNVLALFL